MSEEITHTKNTKRIKTEAFILTKLDTLDPSKLNGNRYRKMFSRMNDEVFHQWMLDIKDKKRKLVLYVPNMIVHVKMETILEVAKELNLTFFERLRLWDSVTKRYYMTPQKYLVLRLPVRRLKQYLESKISVPESDNLIDLYSGQVIKPDKGSSVSLVEIQTILSKNLPNCITEIINIRGGNLPAYAHYKGQLEETGIAHISDIDTNSRVRSAVVVNSYLIAMGISANL